MHALFKAVLSSPNVALVYTLAIGKDHRAKKNSQVVSLSGPADQKEENNKVFRLGRLPESRRLSAQQAAEPHQPAGMPAPADPKGGYTWSSQVPGTR